MAYFGIVTGELTPDATGDYKYGGTFGGTSYARRVSGGWFLWWYGLITSWIISNELGIVGTEYWRREGAQPLGLFTPLSDATGYATVSEGTLTISGPPRRLLLRRL